MKKNVSESDANDDIANELIVKTRKPMKESDADANDDFSNEFSTGSRHSEYR